MVLCERSNSRYSIQTKKTKLVYHILDDDLLFVSRQETSLASSSRNDCDVCVHARIHRPQCIFNKRQVFREQREIIIQVVIIRQCVTSLARTSIVRLPESLSVLQETRRSPFYCYLSHLDVCNCKVLPSIDSIPTTNRGPLYSRLRSILLQSH